jgi:beta-lactamase regulating signal transducer with metallopeptidase domain
MTITADAVLAAILRANAVGALAVMAVLAARLPVRRLLGAEFAYRLWQVPLIAALASFLPPQAEAGAAPAGPPHGIWPPGAAPVVLGLFAAGSLVAVLRLALAQWSFLRAVRRGRAGPAVVGVAAPRIVMPPDDGRFTGEERALIRAHEREHIRRGDPAAAAVITAIQCLAWWNPVAVLAAHLARIDQELACDAAVVRRLAGAGGLYAATLLKSQLAAQALPLGCRWPAAGRHPLETRIALLRRPAREANLAAEALLLAIVVVVAAWAWGSKPPVAPLGRGYEPPQPERHVSVLLIRPPESAQFRAAIPPAARR